MIPSDSGRPSKEAAQPADAAASKLGLSLLSLRDALPARYGALVRWAAIGTVVGYSAAIAQLVVTVGPGVLFHRPEIYTLGLAILSLVLERSHRTLAASVLVLSCVTMDICVSFAISERGLAAASIVQIPILVVGAGLLLGSRGAYGVGLGLPLLAIASVLFGEAYYGGPGIGAEDTIYVIALTIGSVITALLLHIFLRSFGEVLARSRLNEGRLGDVLRSVPDGVLVLSPEGEVESHNDQAAELLALSAAELIGRRVDELPLRRRSEEGPDSSKVLNWKTLAEEGESSEVETTRESALVEMRVQRIFSGTKRDSLLVLLRDVSDRVRGEEREQELAAQLLHSQKLEAVGRLAGGVAHEFNNLLTVVAGYADVIDRFKERRAGLIAAELRATYRRGELLTRQLLSFARRDVVSPRPIDLADVVRGTENLVHRLVGEQVRVIFQASEACPIVADPSQMEQVVMNLATNARDAMGSAGTLKVSCYPEAGRVVLEVADTGAGMSPEVMERIFEPFFTTKERGKGTGLGLATVHGIVTNSGGEIQVDSKPERGTIFRLRWDRSSEEVVEVSSRAPSSRLEQGQGLIVLAEDDVQTRTFVVSALEDAGYDVLAGRDGAESLSLVVHLDRAPDLIVTDVMMPAMTGVELVERVRRQYPNQRVLFMSGYTDDVLEARHLQSMDDLLQKPFGRDALIQKVLQKLGGSP